MYSLAEAEQLNSLEQGSREQLMISVFQEWRHTGTTSSQLAQLEVLTLIQQQPDADPVSFFCYGLIYRDLSVFPPRYSLLTRF